MKKRNYKNKNLLKKIKKIINRIFIVGGFYEKESFIF